MIWCLSEASETRTWSFFQGANRDVTFRVLATEIFSATEMVFSTAKTDISWFVQLVPAWSWRRNCHSIHWFFCRNQRNIDISIVELPIKNGDFSIVMLVYQRVYQENGYLVGGAMCPSWKMMEFVNGKDDIPYMKWKIKFLFETTNQVWTCFQSYPSTHFCWDFGGHIYMGQLQLMADTSEPGWSWKTSENQTNTM